VPVRVARDIALVGAAFALCPLAAALAPDDPVGPIARARQFVALERSLGVFVEPAVHSWVAGHSWVLGAMTALYLSVHVPATVGALVWCRLERPQGFRLARDTFLWTQAIVIAGYLIAPTAPPSMLHGAGFAALPGPPFGAATGFTHTVQSPFAAMPSGHVAFAVVAAAIVAVQARVPWLRLAAVLYPLAVTVIVVGTANHLWLDAIAGAAAAGAGWRVAVIARTARARPENQRAGDSRTDGEHARSDTSPPRRLDRHASA
jgi:PAP2 superfamily protein